MFIRVAKVAVLAAMVLACGSPAAIASQSPAPTESLVVVAPSPATASPSPTAEPVSTVTPTAPPVKTPRIPSTLAGDRLLPFYFDIRQLFPLLPPSIDIDSDESAGTEGNAFFHGLNAQGSPRFAVREDFVMDRGTAAHEIGHAYQAVLEKKFPGQDFKAMYWSFRQFPGTWQQAQLQSQVQTSFSAQWIWSPVESWGEAFRAGVTLEVKERTLDYGKTIDPIAARTFFQSLAATH